MKTQRNIKKKSITLKITSIIFAIVLLAIVSQTSNALEWERMAGDDSPGVLITDERPLCAFSISEYAPQYFIQWQLPVSTFIIERYNIKYNIVGQVIEYSETITVDELQSPVTISFSNIKYDPVGRVIEYHANLTENEYTIETHIYDTDYSSFTHVAGFKELRNYPTSGNTYYIEIFGVSYNGFGQVMDGYLVNINTSLHAKKPNKTISPSPSDEITGQPLVVNLSWSDGGGATSYSIYFGTDSIPDEGEFIYDHPDTTYDPGTLLYGTTYYWRIDAWNNHGTTEGDIWSFTTTDPPDGKIIYVDTDAFGKNDGTSWANAYNYLQDALMIASAGDEIRVAQGIYKPDEGGGNTPGDRKATFHLIDGVTLKGSYTGFGELEPDARDRVVHETILSGDLDGNDLKFINKYENSYHVITGGYIGKTTILDGFIITGGYAGDHEIELTLWEDFENGGGMYNGNNSNPTLTNCTFSNNSASWMGGGMYNGNNSNPTLNNCTLESNSGSGMYNDSNSNITITNCTFNSNSAGYSDGGGMYNGYNSNITITNCRFMGNSAGEGGGLYNYCNSTILINCTFSNNTARSDGGGIYNKWIKNSILTNCTFTENSAQDGRALACDSSLTQRPSHIQLRNCIFWDGQNEIVWEIRNNSDSSINITYSNIQGGWPGEGNIDTDPLFVDPNGDDEIIGTLDDDFRLLENSPCIDAGDNSAVPPSLATDIVGNPRIFDSIVDMGAYEHCDSLVAHWSMDDKAGNTKVVDISGNGNDGTAQRNTSVLHTDGLIGGALSFNGISDFVNLGSPALLDDLPTGDFSVSAWINDQSPSGKRMIMGVYPGGTTGWVLRKHSGDSGRYIDFWIGHSDTGANFATPGGSILPNSWHHIVAVWDAGTKTCKIYIDDIESSYAKTEAGQGSYNSDASYDKEIGRMAYYDGIQYFDGAMDQIMIFNKVLSK